MNVKTIMFILSDTSTAGFQPLTQVSITAATIGLTSGFGMGPGRALSLWPALVLNIIRVKLTFLYTSMNMT